MRFEHYHEPQSMTECLHLLSHYGPEAKPLAGGTDLVLRIRARTIKPKAVIYLARLAELYRFKEVNGKGIEIGALHTLSRITREPMLGGSLDIVRQGAGSVSTIHVRNVATLGGNSCNAAPSADTVPGLIAVQAHALILGPQGERRVPLEDFFIGPGKTVLKSGEILTGFFIPTPTVAAGGAYKKFAPRGNVEVAVVGVAAQLCLSRDGAVAEAKIVLGAVGPTPIRARRTEQLLLGHFIKKDILVEAARVSAEDAKPISDQRATASYRREMVRVWTKYALCDAFAKAQINSQETAGL